MTSAHSSIVERVATGWPTGSAWLRSQVPPPNFEAYRHAVAQRLTAGAQVIETDAGVAVWRRLPWDSEQVRMNAARVDAIVPEGLGRERELLSELTSHVGGEGIGHVFARIGSGEWPIIHAIIREGWLLIDGMLTYAIPVAEGGGPKDVGKAWTRQARSHDLDTIIDRGKSLFRTGRFYSDPSFDVETADKLYAAWIRNSVLGTAADTVIIAEDESGILGFVTLVKDDLTIDVLEWPILQIGLIGTFDSAQRRGVGSMLVQAGLEYAGSNAYRAVEVGTQVSNIAASRLYESAGFRLVNSSHTFRWVPSPPTVPKMPSSPTRAAD